MNRDEILRYLKEHKQELRKNFGVIKIGLFGSYAKNENTQSSDIDISVEIDKKYKKLHNFLSLKRELSNVFGKKVDLGIGSTLKPIAKRQIDKEIIYV